MSGESRTTFAALVPNLQAHCRSRGAFTRNRPVECVESTASIVVDRTPLSAVVANSTCRQHFVDLIAQEHFLQARQQILGFIKAQTEGLRCRIVGRTVKSRDFAPLSTSIVKGSLN